MSDKVFIDTNLLIYSISKESKKSYIVENLLLQPFDFIISTQVINEFVQVCFKKSLIPSEDIRQVVGDFLQFFEVVVIEDITILSALNIKDKYRYAWYDSLIIASALENNCTLLFSEDISNGQQIEQSLTIQNPFMV
jgi:predicted nucleic acid-binding protein